MRWLYHVTFRERAEMAPYTADSLDKEGFIHASYAGDAGESARLYFPEGADLVALQIDPTKLDVPVEVVNTPRGAMPHIHGPVPRSAIRRVLELSELHGAPDTFS